VNGPSQSAAAAPEHPIVVLLVDDQVIVGESVRRMLAAEKGVHFHFCQDPAKAIATANDVKPTVILQDLVMPDIDGLQLVKFFRANKATRDTPMIVLSSKEDPEIKAQAFALGANDYLVKWPDKLEVVARIRYHSRGYIALLERNEAYRQLAESQRLLAEEVGQAAKYVQSLLPAKRSGDVTIDWRFVPSTQLAGDMFGYNQLDDDHLAIYLLDVSGHGVGSALLAVSASNLLTNRSLPTVDFRDPAAVLTRLNEVFQMEKQNEKYFTIWYGVLQLSTRTLKYSNAGHPPPLFFLPGGELLKATQLTSTNLAVGMAEGIEYDNSVVAAPAGSRLLVFSDGVFEIERPEGPMWTYPEFVDFLNAMKVNESSAMDRLLAHVRELHGPGPLGDDFSIIEARL
jgi:phosphoserine phosphatase RsbU/P